MEAQTENYSPIQHLASIVCPPWLDRDGMLFIMLTFAFDAGGDDGTENVTVAGFASSAKDWDEFSVKWKARLNKDGIEFFHAVDAAFFRGPFAHWHDLSNREQLRRSLFADLIDLIKSHVYQKFSCTIVNKEFQKMSEDLREQFLLCAYSLAGRSCEKYARKWAMEEWRSCPEMVIALVFEAGDRGHGKLQQKLIADSGHLVPTFRPKKDMLRDDGMIEPGFVPLQAGDWFAWEINRATKDAHDRKLKSIESLRWPMRQFLGYPPGYMGIYEPSNIAELESGLDLQNKISAWATAAGLDKKSTSS